MICYPTPKINIGLNVLRKRPDGYHDIETLFYPVAAFSDELEIVRADGLPEGSPFAAGKPVRDGFSITIEGADWDPQDDLTAKAWRLLAAEYGIGPVRIRMRKGIPVGAGLGGGSSDCACALKMMSEIFGLGLSVERLEQLAGRLGADCAFFVRGIPQWGSGIGDILSPASLDLSAYDIRLALPSGVHVSTAEAYAGLTPRDKWPSAQIPDTAFHDAPSGQISDSSLSHTPSFGLRKPCQDISLHDAISLPVEQWRDLVVNDFEKSVFPRHPEIASLKAQMYADGALYASMTGSGSAVFGIFR